MVLIIEKLRPNRGGGEKLDLPIRSETPVSKGFTYEVRTLWISCQWGCPRGRQERPLPLKRTKREARPGAVPSLGDERKNVQRPGVLGWAITPDMGRP